MIQMNDLINGSFEIGGAIFHCFSIRKLYHSKQVRGVSWTPFAYFMIFGLWNLFYYPSLDQWFSFVGGIAIITTNIIWLVLAWRYRKN